MRKNEQDKLSRIQIQDELNAQADMPLDEVDVERIEKLVKRLNEYDKVRPDLSDYNRFLAEFNSKNGVKLQNSGGNKKFRLFSSRRTVFKISSKLASAAAVIVLAVFVSNAAVKADASDSILSWLSEVKNSVVFAFSDESYKQWVLDNEKIKPENEFEYYRLNYSASNRIFGEMQVLNNEVDFDEIDWSDTMKPNYIPKGYNVGGLDMIYDDSCLGRLFIFYDGPGDEYINISVERWSQKDDFVKSSRSLDSVYDETININGFTAYIFTGESISEAFFCKDGKIYNIRTTLNKESLQKILKNMSYENS